MRRAIGADVGVTERREAQTKPGVRGRTTAALSIVAGAVGIVLLLASVSDAFATGLPAADIAVLHELENGRLIGAGSNALFHIDVDSGVAETIALPASAASVSAMAANRSGRIYVASPGSGVWVSRDGGESWKAGNSGLPEGVVTSLATHARDEDVVYAYLSGDGIYRSEDGGGVWHLMDNGPEGMTGPLIHSDMPGSMQTGWLFAATTNGVSRSMDCFCQWRLAGTVAGEVSALTFDPRQPAHLYAATGEGVFRSHDGGEGWVASRAPAPRIASLLFTSTGMLYGLSAGGALYASADESQSWRRIDGF